jgi:pilus assembly protein CpaB
LLKGTRKYWAIAILCGLLASFSSYQYIQKLKTSYEPDDLVTVAVASKNIKADSIITNDQVELRKIPAQYTLNSCFHQKEQVVGKAATDEIVAGEQILPSKLLSSTAKSDRLSYKIPISKRAVSIAVDSVSGVSGYIQPGDRVDILGTLDISVANGKPSTWTVFTLQNIQVLAVGDNTAASNKKSSSTTKSTLVLAVAPEEVQRLVMVSERGNIRALLRSPVDHSKVMAYPYPLENLLK